MFSNNQKVNMSWTSDANNLSTKVLQTIKCDLCDCYLSIPPIILISNDGEKHKCGRCKDIPTAVNIRNKVYEMMATSFNFPCTYKNCNQKLSWDEVKNHEEMCPFKSYHCNFLENCTDAIEYSEFERHYKNKGHSRSSLFYELLVRRNLKFGVRGVCLLIKNKMPFLIYCNPLQEDFWFSVFSLKPTENKLTYQIKLTPETSGGCSLLCENQKIIPFNDREHCAKCIFKKCDVKYHKPSPDFKTTKLSTEDVKLLKSSFTCTISINEDLGLGVEERELPMNNLHISNNNNLIKDSLQCPICEDWMDGRIYCCNKGHVVCGNCMEMMAHCPSCRAKFKETRNFALENLAENAKLNCLNLKKGCNFVGNVTRLKRHEEICILNIEL